MLSFTSKVIVSQAYISFSLLSLYPVCYGTVYILIKQYITQLDSISKFGIFSSYRRISTASMSFRKENEEPFDWWVLIPYKTESSHITKQHRKANTRSHQV